MNRDFTKAVLSLLETDIAQAEEHLLAAMEAEYPLLLEEERRRFRSQYGAGCGERMSPVTAVAEALAEVEKQGLATSRLVNGKRLWRLVAGDDRT